MTELNIRDFKGNDVLAVAQIEADCFSSPWSEKALSDELENPNANFLVCEKDDIICGYIGSIFVCDEASVTNVAVSPLFRRQGIGEALVSGLILRAKEKGIQSIFLEVRESNIAAQKLYKKCGFDAVSIRKGFYSNPKEDAIIMKYEMMK